MTDPSGLFGLAGVSIGMAIAGNLRGMKVEADMLAFDLAATFFDGIQAGSSTNEMLWSFFGNQLTGLGIGFAIGKVSGVLSEIWENGVTIGRPRGAAVIGEPLVFVNNRRFRSSFRYATDFDVSGIPATNTLGHAQSRIDAVFQSPVQRQRARQWVDFATSNNAQDVRLDQWQVSTDVTYRGQNRPDIQFTLEPGTYTLPNNGVIQVEQPTRIYIELDGPRSGRGPDHLKRIVTNDPEGLVVLETNTNSGILDSLIVL